jgi:hypothetical protein
MRLSSVTISLSSFRKRVILRLLVFCGVSMFYAERYIRNLTSAGLLLIVPLSLFAQVNVLTYRGDNMRTGQNIAETTLAPSNVQSTAFGRLFSFPVDGLVDAQPLVVSGLTVPGAGVRNVVVAVTEHDSVYLFDADTGVSYWHRSLLKAGETTSEARGGCSQVTPEIGITSTPVIDLKAGPHGTIYVVAMSKDSQANYYQRLHALDLTTGAEEFGGPVDVHATFPGTGDNSVSGRVVFDPKQYKERTGLLLVKGVVYTSWASHCDARPYTGWTVGYDQNTLAQVSVFNFSPNGNEAAIWGAGGGTAADAQGNLYFDIANGTFDTSLNGAGFPALGDFGNAFVKVAPVGGVLTALDYWTMDNTVAESRVDQDLGSGGVLLLPDVVDSGGKTRHLGTGAGKDNNVYIFDRDNMGKFNSSSNNNIYQELPGVLTGGEYGSPAWFNGNLYYGSNGDVIRCFRIAGGKFGATPTSRTPISFRYPGATPSISANGTNNAILWAVEDINPAVLHAYDANNLATEYYNSSQAPSGRDQFGNGNKYITPVIANGKVFVGTQNSVAVFGLLGHSTAILSSGSLAFGNQTVNTPSSAQTVKLTNEGPGALAITAVTVAGSNPGDFAQTNNCPVSPVTLAVNGFCTISVTFRPVVASARTAAITISDNAANTPQTVTLSGTGVGSVLQTWPNGYTYEATFTVAAGKVPSSQTNFPALIASTIPDFAMLGSGGKISNTCNQKIGNNSIPVPCDLIFTADAAGTTPLRWEFETYNAITGAVNIWVNAPQLSSGTVIYAWYGKASVTTLQTVPTATWNNRFLAVYHLKENPAGAAPQMNDSTPNANHATMNGAVQNAQQQPGEIDGSINFLGNTWAGMANPGNFNFDRSDPFSLSGWFEGAPNSGGTLLSKMAAVPVSGWGLLQFPSAGGVSFAFGLFGNVNAKNYLLAQTGTVGGGLWHQVVVTNSGSGTVAGIKVYIDGVIQHLNTIQDSLTLSTLNAITPAINGRGGPSQMSADVMDEIRVSAKGVVLSPDWVTASFNNESRPGTFFNVVTGLTNSGH